MANYWRKILLAIYLFSPSLHSGGKISFFSDQHELAKHLKISGSDLGDGLTFLEDQGLITTISFLGVHSDSLITLSEKGFNVALEIEKQVRENREKERHFELQLTLAFLTFILAITSIANFAIKIYPEYSTYYFWFLCVFLLGFTGGILLKFFLRKN